MGLALKLRILHWWRWIHLLICLIDATNGQISYAIMEELEKGTIIGNLAQDLQMDPKLLFNRKFHMTYDTKIQYFDINSVTGTLHITNTIDREELCASSAHCVMRLGLVMDVPLVLYHIEINILDINDNAPCFKENEIVLAIAESTDPGSRFPLEGAFDPDASSNSVCSYFMSPNDLFEIDVHVSDYKMKSLTLVLKIALDREQQAIYVLSLTASDCGKPKLTGSAQIKILVQDANDNPPIFSDSLYRLIIPENYTVGNVLMTVNATDNDEGKNGDIEYSFSSIVPINVQKIFDIDKESGQISLKGNIDYEERTFYEFKVQARDHGQLPLTGHCKVIVEITDVNDNSPEIKVTSLSSIKEDAKPGFVIALLTVTDRDSGNNSKVSCEIPDHLPVTLQSKFLNYYSLVLKHSLDRESTEEYNVLILATDSGFPPLSSATSIKFTVLDVNDNAPIFLNPSYRISVPENTLPETLIFQVSALDKDINENARLSYFLTPSSTGRVKSSSFITIRSDSGEIFLANSLDYEKIQMLCIVIEAKDHGSPSLSSTASLTVFIQDKNDNSPQILPSLFTGEVWRSTQVGHVITKVKAFDLDSGYNAWLRYEMISFTNASLFRVELYTGDIIVSRVIEETDEDLQNIFIVIKDHGEPPKSTMTVVTITLLQSREEELDNIVLLGKDKIIIVDFNGHLIIAISFISSIFLLAVVSYIGIKYVKTFRVISKVIKTEDCVSNDWTWTENKKRDYNFTPMYFNAQPDYNTSPHPPWTYFSADEVLFPGQMPEDESTLRAESEVRNTEVYTP
ncbi:protocadherin alpha-4-like [Dendrobates tinctorius]|uniref:protocadherin alpha-4-like n=1 Tax=Dendrobates tinctorius TaxID=92724 RepID=UPI003CCA6145